MWWYVSSKPFSPTGLWSLKLSIWTEHRNSQSNSSFEWWVWYEHALHVNVWIVDPPATMYSNMFRQSSSIDVLWKMKREVSWGKNGSRRLFDGNYHAKKIFGWINILFVLIHKVFCNEWLDHLIDEGVYLRTSIAVD